MYCTLSGPTATLRILPPAKMMDVNRLQCTSTHLTEGHNDTNRCNRCTVAGILNGDEWAGCVDTFLEVQSRLQP